MMVRSGSRMIVRPPSVDFATFAAQFVYPAQRLPLRGLRHYSGTRRSRRDRLRLLR